MCFGIASAPGIFQRTMENLDDNLIAVNTSTEHCRSLSEVLTHLEKAEIHLKRPKCIFLASKVTYLGHCLNKDGIQPVHQMVKTIQDSPRPTNIKELQAFLSKLNYYAC